MGGNFNSILGFASYGYQNNPYLIRAAGSHGTTTLTWDAGGTSDTNWATAANWHPDGLPVAEAETATSFGGQTTGAAASGSFGAATVTGSGGGSTGGASAHVHEPIAKGLPVAPAMRQMQESLGDRALARPPATDGRPAGVAKVGRNDPCWCGSGVKYKKCHGR